MTSQLPPLFKVQKFRGRWERIDKDTGETVAAGWSGGALYRITHADKTVGIFPTGADKTDPEPPPNGHLVEHVQVLDDTLPDLDISAVWVVTTTSHSTRHGGETYYHPHWWMDLSVDITDPNVTLEHLEELKLKSINRIPEEQRRHVSSVKLLANLTESLEHHEPHH